MPDWLVWTHGCPGGETVAQVSHRADQAIAMALEHMQSRDVVFVGHGHFSRSVLTRWIEQPLYEGIRFSMAAASIGICGFEHRVRQTHRARPDRPRQPLSALVTSESPSRVAPLSPASGGTPSTERSFLLAGRDGVVVGDGVHTAYPDLADARAALASGDDTDHLGRLALRRIEPDRSDPAQNRALHRGAAGVVAARTLPAVRIVAMSPSPDEHRARIATALEALNDPRSGLHKVVLAPGRCTWPPTMRSTSTPWSADWPPTRAPTRSTSTSPQRAVTTSGTALVGASPELLVARRGELVTCRPFAGSAPRSADPAVDRANGAALAESAKNLHEHQLVVDEMRKALDPLCVDLQIAPEPELSSTSTVWHLSTPISGRIRETSTTALDLAVALHPTPAVGGVPRDAAAALITELEGDRGFYAGAVGWCDAAGDGKWVVSIRCAVLSADRRSAVARSGGGIVAESDPDDEVAETTTKFRTILSALGVNQ